VLAWSTAPVTGRDMELAVHHFGLRAVFSHFQVEGSVHVHRHRHRFDLPATLTKQVRRRLCLR